MTQSLPEKILCVDDDMILRELLQAIFEGLDGFKVRLAENGAQAIEVLADFKPDLILLDLSMPEMDGAELLHRMQAIEGVKGIPVIFITQFQNIEMGGNYDKLGVIGVIHKPINPEMVLKDIRDIWDARPSNI